MGQSERQCAVFGANGYIGRHLVDALMRSGICVKAFDVQEFPFSAGVDYRKVDISDPSMLQDISWDVDAVYMFAGITGTYDGFVEYEKFTFVNEIGLLNILNAIRQSAFRPKVIFPSTRLVYQGSDSPLREEAAKMPKTIYATNKLACEYNLEEYRNVFDIDYTIYRICVPYGNLVGQDISYGTIGFFLSQAKASRQINLYGDGSLRRTFTHIEDICEQILATAEDTRSSGEIFNILGEDYSLRDAATIIARRYGAELNYVPWPEEQLRIESGHTVFNADKIRSSFAIDLRHRFTAWIDGIQVGR